MKTSSLKLTQFVISALVLCLLTIGCGPSEEPVPVGEVEGTITMNDEPLADGSISFYNPVTGDSVGGSIADGKFTFTQPVPAGTYQVAVQPPPPPQPDDQASGELANVGNIIPDGYLDGATSGIEASVKEGPNTFEFKLSEDGPALNSDDPAP